MPIREFEFAKRHFFGIKIGKDDTMKDYLIDKIFIISKQPVLFADLLKANALFNEGMLVDPAKLNYRFAYGSLYGLYSVICLLILLFAIALLHKVFTNIDFHFSIICTALATALVFLGFDAFKIWARKQISARQIKAAWALHFPYFPYEKYSQIIERIYNEAIKNEVPRRELEKYVLDKLVESAGASS